MTHVNASLIHEVRMIIRQILQHRELGSVFKSDAPRFSCAICLRTKRPKPGKVVAIVGGNSVCVNHFA